MMTNNRTPEYLEGLINELLKQPKETEWLEFKHNKADHEEIGEYISALSNSALLAGKVNAYIIWGVDNSSHEIIGTKFCPSEYKVGGEELESWLLRLLEPKINFQFHSLFIKSVRVVMLEIDAATRHPVRFSGQEYVRIGSYMKKLKDFPEKERTLWRLFDHTPYERGIAAENVTGSEVLRLIDYLSYFDLLGVLVPDGNSAILEAISKDGLIQRSQAGDWNITNLGAILFAKRLDDFPGISRKAIRVIQYKGQGRTEAIREQVGSKGYACGFRGLIEFIMMLVPANEVIVEALRKEVPMFPELAVRELVANALIHQDFFAIGSAPMVEIFEDRIEITNPGAPLVETQRFIDSPPKSRNETLASLMRRLHICEERGSGIDKVVFQVELYQLPAPCFEAPPGYTKAVLFAHKNLNSMDKADRVRACYLHACLKWVMRDYLTNASLRVRFGVEDRNKATVSRYIKEAVESGRIVQFDEDASRKYMKYDFFGRKVLIDG